MKFVLYFETTQPWREKMTQLAEEFPQIEFVRAEERTDQDIEEAQAFIGGFIPSEDFQRARELKMVFLTYTGANALPQKALCDRGIRISNTHGNGRYVAERGIAMALGFYGKIIEYHEDLKKPKWHGIWAGGGLKDTWESIQGKRCAVIGTGEIGKWVARLGLLKD